MQACNHTDIVTPLLDWYEANARALPWRNTREPYRVWLSEIMLQQTRVEAVVGYYERFLQQLPDIQALAAAEEPKLLKLWEGLGYYNRARNLKRAAQKIMESYAGRFPETYEDILSLPGVGPYTAGAIASICFEQPTPAVDGNVLRVMARLEAYDKPNDAPSYKTQVEKTLRKIYPAGRCGAFTQSLMELGATCCLPNGAPKCGCCPLQQFCRAHAAGLTRVLPRRSEKRARKIEWRTVFLLECDGRRALRRRPSAGLLAGMYEFPNVVGQLDPSAAAALLGEWGLEPLALRRRMERVHVFTHVEWRMTGYLFSCAKQAAPFLWVAPQSMRRDIALPTAFRQFLEGNEDEKHL